MTGSVTSSATPSANPSTTLNVAAAPSVNASASPAVDLFARAAYTFDLPPELIAQQPCSPRDASRLLIVDRATGTLQEGTFRDLAHHLGATDCLVYNDTRVIPARLIGQRATGGVTEALLLREEALGVWEAMVRPAKKLPLHATIAFGTECVAEVVEVLPEGRRLLHFKGERPFAEFLEAYGQIPLPPYIRGGVEEPQDRLNYQTVYARAAGSAAAPTAGLHFTPELLEQLRARKVGEVHVTLHTGAGTFRPVQTDDIRNHAMHTEQYVISPQAAEALMLAKRQNKRLICVGTTSCRTLESAAAASGLLQAGEYQTNLFIHPGYQFKAVDSLITNFHLPSSSLLMLVAAFAGYELMRRAYAYAVEHRFRFFSYGDAMWIK